MPELDQSSKAIGALEAVTGMLQKQHKETTDKLDVIIGELGNVKSSTEKAHQRIDWMENRQDLKDAITTAAWVRDFKKRVWYSLGGGSLVLGTGVFATNKFWAWLWTALQALR